MNAEEFILSQIGPYLVKKAGKYGFLLCPFHEDQDPSCKINLEYSGGYPAGTYYCFGCGQSGSWNKLAKALNLPLLDKVNLLESLPSTIEKKLEAYHNPQKTYYDLPWENDIPENFIWRNIPGNFLKSWGCKIGPDPVEWISGGQTGEQRLYLFTKTRRGAPLGWVATKLDNSTSDIKIYNMPGDWTHKALLPNLFGMAKRICLVEGPFDAFKLLWLGIPAMSVMGVQSWSQAKINQIIQGQYKKVLIIGDADAAGFGWNQKVYRDLRPYGIGDIFWLPQNEKVIENGEEKNMDPGNMPMSWLERVRQALVD